MVYNTRPGCTTFSWQCTAVLSLHLYALQFICICGRVLTGLTPVIKRTWVRLPVIPLPCNDSQQVVHTCIPLRPSSTILYWPQDGDTLWMGR